VTLGKPMADVNRLVHPVNGMRNSAMRWGQPYPEGRHRLSVTTNEGQT